MHQTRLDDGGDAVEEAVSNDVKVESSQRQRRHAQEMVILCGKGVLRIRDSRR
jgi:hypothetical protein